MADLTCEEASCGQPFTARDRRARFCSPRCRKRAYRARERSKIPAAARGASETILAGPPALPDGLTCGKVEEKVRADLAALVTAHPMGEALSEMSFALARMLDDGAGLATAAVNRELRANLAELSRMAADDGDDLADELSAPVRDQEEL